MSAEAQLSRFRTVFERMSAPQRAAAWSRLQVYIATQVNDPVVLACPMANQVENHFRTPVGSVNAVWWNTLNLWRTSPLVAKILTQV